MTVPLVVGVGVTSTAIVVLAVILQQVCSIMYFFSVANFSKLTKKNVDWFCVSHSDVYNGHVLVWYHDHISSSPI